jgi:hypothetical protein
LRPPETSLHMNRVANHYCLFNVNYISIDDN